MSTGQGKSGSGSQSPEALTPRAVVPAAAAQSFPFCQGASSLGLGLLNFFLKGVWGRNPAPAAFHPTQGCMSSWGRRGGPRRTCLQRCLRRPRPGSAAQRELAPVPAPGAVSPRPGKEAQPLLPRPQALAETRLPSFQRTAAPFTHVLSVRRLSLQQAGGCASGPGSPCAGDKRPRAPRHPTEAFTSPCPAAADGGNWGRAAEKARGTAWAQGRAPGRARKTATSASCGPGSLSRFRPRLLPEAPAGERPPAGRSRVPPAGLRLLQPGLQGPGLGTALSLPGTQLEVLTRGEYAPATQHGAGIEATLPSLGTGQKCPNPRKNEMPK